MHNDDDTATPTPTPTPIPLGDGAPVVRGPFPYGCAKVHTRRDKWLMAIVGGVLFFIISNPGLYRLTNGVADRLGIALSSKGGCPNILGLTVHTLLFLLVVYWLIK